MRDGRDDRSVAVVVALSVVPGKISVEHDDAGRVRLEAAAELGEPVIDAGIDDGNTSAGARGRPRRMGSFADQRQTAAKSLS
jgi:hypothetical protein